MGPVPELQQENKTMMADTEQRKNLKCFQHLNCLGFSHQQWIKPCLNKGKQPAHSRVAHTHNATQRLRSLNMEEWLRGCSNLGHDDGKGWAISRCYTFPEPNAQRKGKCCQAAELQKCHLSTGAAFCRLGLGAILQPPEASQPFHDETEACKPRMSTWKPSTGTKTFPPADCVSSTSICRACEELVQPGNEGINPTSVHVFAHNLAASCRPLPSPFQHHCLQPNCNLR